MRKFFSKTNVIIICVFLAVPVFIASRWMTVKESPGYEIAIQLMLSEDKSLSRDDLNMVGFSRTTPAGKTGIDEIIYYKFEVRGDLKFEVASSRRGEIWTAEIFNPK